MPLTVEEQAVGGIHGDGGILRLRPSRRERLVDLVTSAVAEGVLVTAALVWGGLEVLWLAGLAAFRLLGAAAGMFCVVRATDDVVVVRNRWGRQVVPVASIRRVVVMETDDDPDGDRWPGRLWNRRIAAPELALDDGRRIRCWAMTSRRSRRDRGRPAPADLKAAVLRRWLGLPPE